MPKVLVGMSGGVDSSVTAYLLKQKGFEVEGLSFILWEARNRSSFTTCCSLEAMDGASKTAESLGIKHYSLDVREEFIEKVIEPFIDAYTNGKTPNPCILCNKYIKFPFLLKEAQQRGIEYIATGHYARTEKGDNESDQETVFLKKGMDPRKDQSYVLYILKREELNRLVLPLGEYKKEDVRAIARSLGLAAADRPESQEICFIEDRNYFKFIQKLSPVAGEPGPIMDMGGKVIGRHKGIYCYTIGQRKGLGIPSPEPYYVTRIDALKNAIYVGSAEEAKIKRFFVDDIDWLVKPGSDLFRATVKVRSMMEDKPATIEILNDGTRVTFDEPQWAPAPGQSAVFYADDKVFGGGIIVMD
ncbi:MAG: tRNA 2-thiouridine(34) synthase MnmA [Nitrospirota bacterium]